MTLRDDSVYRRRIGAAATKVKAMIRRLTIGVTTGGLWQLFGVDDEEESDVENFSGIGFYSRPRDDANAEVVICKIGGSSQHPVIVATRDEEARQIIAAIRDMAANETAIHTTLARVHILADGTVEVDDGSGAVALARADHKHGGGMYTNSGGAVTGTSGASDSNTTILKGK